MRLLVPIAIVVSTLIAGQANLVERMATAHKLPPGSKHVRVRSLAPGENELALSEVDAARGGGEDVATGALAVRCRRVSPQEHSSTGEDTKRTVTVLLEAGMPFSGIVSFDPVLQEAERFYANSAGRGTGPKLPVLRLCTVDRAGYGWSPPLWSLRDVRNVVFEQAQALRSAGIKPDVLVGWSYGALVAQFALFSRQAATVNSVSNKNRVTLLEQAYGSVEALVLVDPVMPSHTDDPVFLGEVSRGKLSFQLLQALAPLGGAFLLRLSGLAPAESGFAQGSWPAQAFRWGADHASGAQFSRTAAAELAALPSSLEATAALGRSLATKETKDKAKYPLRLVSLALSDDVAGVERDRLLSVITNSTKKMKTNSRSDAPPVVYSGAKVHVDLLGGDHYVPLHNPSGLLNVIIDTSELLLSERHQH